ncbi:MAG: flagellar hook-associated protein FlgL [Planctomycetota bacterium]|jgi:flagellar hook-associated protein 3 FlgL
MTVRITQAMLFSRALQDIRRSSLGMLRLQEQVASGRLMNRPSDDPAKALRIMPLNNELRDLAHIKDNLGLARETIDLASATLEEASSAMARLQELMLQAANSTVSGRDRQTLSIEVNHLLEQMVGIGNLQRGDTFLFGGMRSDQPPFRLVTDAGGTRVIYDGDQSRYKIEVTPGIRMALRTPGDALFQQRNRGATLIEGTTGAAASGATDTGVGFGKLEVTFKELDAATLPAGISASASTANSTAVGNLTYNFAGGQLSINGGPAVPVPATDQAFQTGDTPPRTIYLTVGAAVVPASGTFTAKANLSTDGGASVKEVAFTTTNVQVKNSYDSSVLNVDVTNLDRIGTDDVTFQGTFDVFTTLIAVRDVLQNDDGLSDTEVADRVRELLDDVKAAHDQVLAGVQEHGYKAQTLDMLEDRVDTLTLTGQESLSRVQDVDLSAAIMELTQRQFNFQAALQVGARVVQTSLLDFLR